MAGKYHHRGVGFSVESVGGRRWRWELLPPNCVLGLVPEVGEIDGDHTDAVKAAQKAIEAQVCVQ